MTMTAILVFAVGLILLVYGCWNLRFGPENIWGFVAVIVSIAMLLCGLIL